MEINSKERLILLEALGLYAERVNENHDDPSEVADEINRCVSLVLKVQLEPTPTA